MITLVNITYLQHSYLICVDLTEWNFLFYVFTNELFTNTVL